MRRQNILFFIVILILIVNGCLTNTRQPEQSVTPSVSGTTWSGTDSDGEYNEYHFQPDGTLHYKIPSGFWTNGTWKQNGDSIYLEMNNRFSELDGIIRNNTMEGNGNNEEGHVWTWKAKKR